MSSFLRKKMFVYFACVFFFISFSYALLTAESPLSIGQTLSSSNEVYELGFFSSNNSKNQYVGIWYKQLIPRVVVWVANRENPVTDTASKLTITSNGSLVLLDGKLDIIWSIGDIFASDGSLAELTDTGNLIVKDNVSGRVIWQSFDHLCDTMLPYSSLMYNLATGENRVLTSWKSYTDPSPGDFVGHITPQVPSQAVILRGSMPYWRSGPWAKTKFTGVIMDETYTSPFSLYQDSNGSGFFSYLQKTSKLSRITLTPAGSLEIFQYNGKEWVFIFVTPANSCDFYGVCGPFGLCVMSSPPKCECLKGFVPKFIDEWGRGNWTGGCVRHTELHCQGKNSIGKDVNVFHTVANIKPPDFYQYVYTGDAKACYQICFRNCSCLAFAYVHGIGCLMWNQDLIDIMQLSEGGELLSIRLARSELDGDERKKTITASIVSLSLFMILSSAAFGFWRYRKHNVSSHRSKDASLNGWRTVLKPENVPGLNFFEINTIQTATDNFSLSNKLGQGGFGSVYKGKLEDGKEIAVKRLSSSSGQGKDEFMNELLLISKLQHRNLVRVLGCCIEGEEKLLIYEFMMNKSLDTFIFDSRKKLEIDWPKRFVIIQDVARGLVYLHRDSRLRIIHRDLKVSNILLDEKMNPKISDFGLARMFQGTQCQDNTLRIVGTLGYMSPEYAWTGMFSEKSDMYSFGVLLLEIISGEKISRFDQEGNLLAYAWRSWCENGGVNFLDQDLADSCRPLEVGMCVQIGLLCVQQHSVDRPNTLQVLSMLTTTCDLPLPTEPAFAVRTRDEEGRGLISVNEMTQSEIMGR